jgi:hypothetical protein
MIARLRLRAGGGIEVYREARFSIIIELCGCGLRWANLKGENLDITIWRCVRSFTLRYRNIENIVILHSKSGLQAYRIVISRISLQLESL